MPMSNAEKVVWRIAELRRKHPRMTFCQLFLNITEGEAIHKCKTQTYFMSDEDMLKRIEDWDGIERRPY